MEEKKEDTLRKFIKEDNDKYETFEEFLRALLSTFMPEKYLQICMSEKMEMLPQAIQKGQNRQIATAGPLDFFRAAFTQRYVRSFNSENLETLGDSVLKSLLMLFFFKNWPNISDPKYLTDLSQFYENNDQFAGYSEQLGFIKWIQADPVAGLTVKDRGDVFEAFVGALVMVGEYFIGDFMGQFMATEFIFKFYRLQEWHIEDRSFYNVAASLFNDWVQSQQSKKPKKILSIDKQLPDGTWMVILAWKGEIIQKITGDSIITAEGLGIKKSAANENAYIALTNRLGITRETIDLLRSENREPEIIVQEERLKKLNPKAEILRLDKRAGLSIAYIREPVEKQIGGNKFTIQEVTYRGRGATPLEAITDVVNNYINKIGKFRPLPYNEDIMNPDISVPVTLTPVAPARLLGGDLQREGKGGQTFKGVPKEYEGEVKKPPGKYGFRPPSGGGRGRGRGRGK